MNIQCPMARKKVPFNRVNLEYTVTLTRMATYIATKLNKTDQRTFCVCSFNIKEKFVFKHRYKKLLEILLKFYNDDMELLSWQHYT